MENKNDYLPVTLTSAQIAEIKQEMVKVGVPVKFMYQGRAVANLTTGSLHSKGINVIHQTHYWNFTKETSKKIAGWLGVNAVFSD